MTASLVASAEVNTLARSGAMPSTLVSVRSLWSALASVSAVGRGWIALSLELAHSHRDEIGLARTVRRRNRIGRAGHDRHGQTEERNQKASQPVTSIHEKRTSLRAEHGETIPVHCAAIRLLASIAFTKALPADMTRFLVDEPVIFEGSGRGSPLHPCILDGGGNCKNQRKSPQGCKDARMQQVSVPSSARLHGTRHCRRASRFRTSIPRSSVSSEAAYEMRMWVSRRLKTFPGIIKQLCWMAAVTNSVPVPHGAFGKR